MKKLSTITTHATTAALTHNAAHAPAPLFAIYARLETEADRKAAEALHAARVAAENANTPEEVKTAADLAKAAKAASKAAKEAAKDAPRFSFDLLADNVKEANAVGRPIAEKAAAAPLASVRAVRHFVNDDGEIDGEALQAAARQIAKKTAANAVQREGTETQRRIDNAARARRWDDPDLADMVSEAALSLMTATTADTHAHYRAATVLRDLAATLRGLRVGHADTALLAVKQAADNR